MSRRELTRIEPRSAVRVGFFLGLLFGVLFGLYSAFLLKGMGNEGLQMFGASEAAELKALGGVSTVLMAVIMGLMGALFYSLVSGLVAIVYNLAARWFGGVEYHVQDIEDDAENSMFVSGHDDE